MGFPIWTLWGMGLAALGALLFLLLALFAQSPLLLQRIGLSRLRLDLRVRAFTSFAFALLLLAMAFFLAGVPLNPGEEVASTSGEESVSLPQIELVPTVSALNELSTSTTTRETPIITTPITPETGAFGGPPVTEVDEQPTSTSTPELATSPVLDPTVTREPSITPTAGQTTEPTVANTATSTESPTATPTPSLTPTPISGATVVINTGGSTIWLKRSPGGQNLTIIHHDDIVILQPRHANQAGQIWQEIRTVNGIIGWILDEFLQTAE